MKFSEWPSIKRLKEKFRAWGKEGIDVDNYPDYILNVLLELPSVLADSESDNDGRERIRVYKEVADIVATELGVSRSKGFFVITKLVGEEELSEAYNPKININPNILERARQILVSIEAEYVAESSRKVTTRLMVYFKLEDKIIKRTLEWVNEWGFVPGDVREHIIRGEKTVTFQLYPRED